jgi:hypothetical protein
MSSPTGETPQQSMLAVLKWVIPIALLVGVIGTVIYFADPLNKTCGQFNGDPAHLGMDLSRAVYDSLPDDVQKSGKLDPNTFSMTVSAFCQSGQDQTLRQVRDDIAAAIRAPSGN